MINLIKNPQEQINKVKPLVPDVEICGEYNGSKMPIELKCKKCGYVWSAIYDCLRMGHMCPVCGGSKQLTKEEFRARVYNNAPFLELLEDYKGNNREKVLCKCKICGYVWNVPPPYFTYPHDRCKVCSGHKVVYGINSLLDVRPDIAKLLKDVNAGKEIGIGYTKNLVFICPDCKNEIIASPYNVVKRGLSCKSCGDGHHYPNKFMYSVLKQIGIKFESEVAFTWLSNRRYDFYIPSKNTIIEVHGQQHYKRGFSGRSLDEEQNNDKMKQLIATENGINRYIVIDARNSTREWMENSIRLSGLIDIISLNQVDFALCDRTACDSMVIKCCALWNEFKTKEYIVEHLSLGKSTVKQYLRKGMDLGLCSHPPFGDIHGRKRVICLNTGIAYESIRQASDSTGDGHNTIAKFCRGLIKKTSSGRRWMYLNDYGEENDKQDYDENYQDSK